MGLILIVEDHDDTRAVLQALCRQWGHQALGAGTGEAGMAMLADHKPDLVIVDGMMPGMSGLEFIRLLRAGETTALIPVILYSAVSDHEFTDNAMEKGANEVWIKGKVDVEQMKQRIARYFH